MANGRGATGAGTTDAGLVGDLKHLGYPTLRSIVGSFVHFLENPRTSAKYLES